MFNFQKAVTPTVSVYSNNSVKLAQTTLSIIGLSDTKDHVFIGKDIASGKVMIASMTEAESVAMAGYDVKKPNSSSQINSKYISTILTGKGATWELQGEGIEYNGLTYFELVCEQEGKKDSVRGVQAPIAEEEIPADEAPDANVF